MSKFAHCRSFLAWNLLNFCANFKSRSRERQKCCLLIGLFSFALSCALKSSKYSCCTILWSDVKKVMLYKAPEAVTQQKERENSLRHWAVNLIVAFIIPLVLCSPSFADASYCLFALQQQQQQRMLFYAVYAYMPLRFYVTWYQFFSLSLLRLAFRLFRFDFSSTRIKHFGSKL